MAERYDFYVHDNRKITFNLTEPIMREDNHVTDWVIHIPKTLNELEVSEWSWCLVYVNAKGEKRREPLELSDDPESPLEKNIGTYSVDYGMSIKAGTVLFAIEGKNADTSGTVLNEWHTYTYEHKVKETIQGDDAEYDDSQKDVMAALIVQVQTKMNQVIGGATPTPVASVSAMTDPSKLYLLTTDGEWYYHNGTQFVSGGVYGAEITDSVPTQGSANAVQSGGVYSALQDVKNGLPEIRTPDETEADLYIGDSDGNVLAKLASGAIETKNFKGFPYITYKSESITYSTLPLTLTVNHKFKKGDKVVLHVDRGAMPWDYGAYVNYYEDDRLVFSGKRIDCAWIEHVITEDTDAIIATYTGQPSTAGMTVGTEYTLEVSLLGDIPIKPTVVKVKKDGTGDFTTLRGALDAIGTKANDVLNPYRIEIYAGTYDVMDDYTDEEISAAVYDQTHFVGPKLLNGMYLVGIGAPGEVVLNGDLDTTQFSSTIRGDISTLNCQGSCGFENLTVIANHLRYCVHDDFHTTIGKKPKRIVKDCIFRGYDISYNPGTTYGAGTSDSGCDYEFENCDYGENAGVHTLPTIAQKSFVHLVNCKGHGFRIGDQETSDPVDGYSIYQFDNCDFLWINHNMSGDVPHVIVRGCGGSSPIIQGSNLLLYDTGDVVAMRNGGFSQTCNVGEVTEWFSNAGHGPRFRKATSVNGASGIVVYKDANDTYIQTKGYVCTNRTALTTFALGDYIGIANSLPVVVSDASNAIGRIAYIDNSGNGYIKLNFGG